MAAISLAHHIILIALHTNHNPISRDRLSRFCSLLDRRYNMGFGLADGKRQVEGYLDELDRRQMIACLERGNKKTYSLEEGGRWELSRMLQTKPVFVSRVAELFHKSCPAGV